MLMKTSAVGCWFVAVFFLLAGQGTIGFAQDEVAPPAESAAAESVPASEPIAESVVAPAPEATPASLPPGGADVAAMRAASAAAEAAAVPVSAPAPAPRATPDERRAALKDADLAALRAAQEESLQAAQAISAYVPELHRQLRETAEDVRQNDPAFQELNRQIAELEAQREQLLANHPAILEKRRAIDQAQQDMLAELRLRTELDGRIEAQAGGTPVAEPVAPAEER